MRAYLDLLRHVLEHGERRTDRTGTGTISVFGTQTRYDLREGFPLVTTKKVLFPAVVRELLWFLRGSTNINDDLHAAHADLGRVGRRARRARADLRLSVAALGREARGIDQIQQAIDTIKRDPTSRRIIVSAWNVADIPKMKLPPCHALFQFYVNDRWLDCQLYQRSADLALGVPFNIASYALLQAMIAQECELVPRHFVHTLGDAHIYLNHVEGVKTQLARDPLPLPKLVLAPKKVLEMTFEDIALEGYQHHPFIKFPSPSDAYGRVVDSARASVTTGACMASWLRALPRARRVRASCCSLAIIATHIVRRRSRGCRSCCSIRSTGARHGVDGGRSRMDEIEDHLSQAQARAVTFEAVLATLEAQLDRHRAMPRATRLDHAARAARPARAGAANGCARVHAAAPSSTRARPTSCTRDDPEEFAEFDATCERLRDVRRMLVATRRRRDSFVCPAD